MFSPRERAEIERQAFQQWFRDRLTDELRVLRVTEGWRLTPHDVQFLQMLKIAPDVPEVR